MALHFFGIGMKTDPFQSSGHCWVFQMYWHIECSTFTASSFRIWNTSTGILSPTLALFIVMLLKAHLTSHSTVSGSKWVITPSCFSWSWRSFFYSPSVYSHHLFLSSASARSILFLSFIVCITEFQGRGSMESSNLHFYHIILLCELVYKIKGWFIKIVSTYIFYFH